LEFEINRPLIEKVRSASEKYDQKYWREICENKEFPVEYWDSLAKSSLFGLVIPKEFGGTAAELTDLAVAVEETAEKYSGIGSYLFLSGCLVSTIFAKSSQEQRQELLPKLARGELKISLALSEEVSGYDATAIETTALKTGEGYEINGSKRFVNNVDRADFLILFARTTPKEKATKKSFGLSMFLVPANSPAIKATKLGKVGMDFINNFDIKVTGLKVRESDLVGELDNAWYNVIDSFNYDRVVTSASLVGTGRLAINDACEHAKKRQVFGKVIGSNQGIQFPLADAMTQLIMAENIMLKAASLAKEGGQKFINSINCALYESVNAAVYATERAMQTLGGHGYYKDYDVERYWRDVRVHKVHPISEELLLAAIGERSLGLPKSY
jgi:acyl-CoA dehydrogenase